VISSCMGWNPSTTNVVWIKVGDFAIPLVTLIKLSH
jgi:hypothetical protein